jgi:hypothetical protein
LLLLLLPQPPPLPPWLLLLRFVFVRFAAAAATALVKHEYEMDWTLDFEPYHNHASCLQILCQRTCRGCLSF